MAGDEVFAVIVINLLVCRRGGGTGGWGGTLGADCINGGVDVAGAALFAFATRAICEAKSSFGLRDGSPGPAGLYAGRLFEDMLSTLSALQFLVRLACRW